MAWQKILAFCFCVAVARYTHCMWTLQFHINTCTHYFRCMYIILMHWTVRQMPFCWLILSIYSITFQRGEWKKGFKCIKFPFFFIAFYFLFKRKTFHTFGMHRWLLNSDAYTERVLWLSNLYSIHIRPKIVPHEKYNNVSTHWRN